MADFDFKTGQFPIATVIDAAQRKAQIEQQARQFGQESLIRGLQTIGDAGQVLYDTKKRVAQALALGNQFGMNPSVTSGLTPEQVLQAANIQKSNVDMKTLWNLLHPGAFNNGEPGGATPASGQSRNPNGAILASDSTTTPVDNSMPTDVMPASPQANSSPVPIQAPPAAPKTVNKATADAAMKMYLANKPVPVLTQADALAARAVPKGARIINPVNGKSIDDPQYQGKLEKQYADYKMKALSNRSGGLGLQDSKVNQAIDLRRLINQYYDPKTGQFIIPPSQHSELALGLARLLSPTGQVGIELMRELKQATGREALSKVLIAAGADPAQVGGPTQSVAKMFIDSVDRQGETAEQLRDQYQQYISDNAPVDLDPNRKAKHDRGRLNSFNDFLSKSPDHMTTSAENGGGWSAEKEKRYQELLAKKQKGSVRL